MKKWLYPTAVLIAVGVLSRLPHPARDIAKLEPVRAVYISVKSGMLSIETDTGASGIGADLTEAAADMRKKADGEIFLDTAQFLLLDPATPLGAELYTLLRPSCKVMFTTTPPDMERISDYLAIHTPPDTLAHLRAMG